MDYLQYVESLITLLRLEMCFKPYYKWITFNTLSQKIIKLESFSFKPYYKWITFNTRNRND